MWPRPPTIGGLTPSAASEPQTKEGAGHERAYHVGGNRCAQGAVARSAVGPGCVFSGHLDGTERGSGGGAFAAEAGKSPAGSRRLLLRSRAVRLCIAAAARGGPGPVPGDRAGAGAARKPGEPIKTDQRDARKLAELYRAGLLTEVQPPTPAEEAVRDLCRARDDARVWIGSGAGTPRQAPASPWAAVRGSCVDPGPRQPGRRSWQRRCAQPFSTTPRTRFQKNLAATGRTERLRWIGSSEGTHFILARRPHNRRKSQLYAGQLRDRLWAHRQPPS